MNLKILIVEDDVATLELMQEILSSLKVEIRALSDSKRALSLVHEERFDGIFLDLQMPQVDGFEIAECIRKSRWNNSAPIVILTAQHDAASMRKAFAAGASFFLQKPIDRQRLTNLFKAARGKMFENRRQFVRIPVHTEVTCQVGHRTFRGASSNLSQGGILFEADGSLSLNAKVCVSFQLPGQTMRIEATGIVARIDDKRRAGVRFTEIGSRELELIRGLLGTEDVSAVAESRADGIQKR